MTLNRSAFDVGELVNFSSKSSAFAHANERYTNPGIIIGTVSQRVFNRAFVAYTVLWADGNVTNESPGYLEKPEDSGCSS